MTRLSDAPAAGEFRSIDGEQFEAVLAAASTLALGVREGLARAIFYLVLLWGMRPFEGGNERLGCLLMNAELSSVGHSRILIPARMRGHLERAIERLLRLGDARRTIRLLTALQQWSALLDFSDLELLVARLDWMRAFERPDPVPAG